MADAINKYIIKTVCVTGAGGYIGSWLVKNLLQKGYAVNATLRDPGDETKSRALLDLPGAEERLKLFKADLTEEGSFDSAVNFCEGVFHLAGPMGPNQHVLEDFVELALKGVLNVLNACTRAKSVRRVVFTSSALAACPLNNRGEIANLKVDESCWSPLDFLKCQQERLAWYIVAKTIAEQEALKYAIDNKIEVVTISPGLVLGPWFTTTPPMTSAQTILSLIGGNDEYYQILKYMESLFSSIPLVHIEDCCNAHIFLMEHPNARGRHICCADFVKLRSLQGLLAERHQQFRRLIKVDAEYGFETVLATSSKKLLDMGFVYKNSLEQTLEQSVECALKNGILRV